MLQCWGCPLEAAPRGAFWGGPGGREEAVLQPRVLRQSARDTVGIAEGKPSCNLWIFADGVQPETEFGPWSSLGLCQTPMLPSFL